MSEASDDGQVVSEEDAKLHPRAARIKLARAQEYLAHLEFARRAKMRLDQETSWLDGELVEARNAVQRYSGWADARIEPRRRLPIILPKEDSPPRRQYLLFPDECGTHPLTPAGDPFPFFCLCGVIVDAERYATFDRIWKTWKAHWLGSPACRVHEPDVRKRSNYFHHQDPAKEQAILDAFAAQVADLEFWCIASVIDKHRFAQIYPSGKVDDFLPPSSSYLMCIDFIFERFVHFLHTVGENAYGIVVAESRGLREDAEVHAEFLRLHLEGTQWQAEHNFRGYLRPYIEFQRKDRNSSGLQIAGLLARPIAEKVRSPTQTPDRWQAISGKFYDGGVRRRSSYGLKIFPAPESEEIFGERTIKANEDDESSPLADQQVLVQ